ncbi:MAG: nitrogenase component 1, partial [Elusimicrobiota bacterium]
MSAPALEKIVIFGKGGIGKSTVTANLAVVYAQQGKRVLVVGCDPKHDTTVVLTGGRMIPTVVGSSGFTDGRTTPDSIIVRGRLGIDCVEAGGPEPGVGCAGRGISRMAEILEANGTLDASRYDDVLGDVVCGGFAAPLRQGFARKVVIVTSEEQMSLYAANNIARAVKTYLSNGIALLGLVANLRGNESEPAVMTDFAGTIGTRVLAHLSRESELFRDAERRTLTVTETAPDSETAKKFRALAHALLTLDPDRAPAPTPLADEEFYELSREDFSRPRTAAAAPAPAVKPAPLARVQEPPAPPSPAEGGLDDLRAHAAAAPQGPEALQWGDAERWRQFFADREFARNRDAGMRFSGPVFWVHHGDIECRYSTPSFDEGLVSFLNLPCVSFPGERVRSESRGGYGETDLKESDIIGGGLESLDAVLKAAEGGGCEIVVVNATCVPVLIGDDWRMVVEKSRRRSGLEVHYNSPSAGQNLDMVKVFFDRLKKDPVFLATKPEPGVVNLIGFPDTVARRELEELLAKAGVEVNLSILPYLDYDQARRFGRASVQVLYPSQAYAGLYESLLSGSSSRRISPPAPYGLVATRRWLREVCAAAGVGAERADAAFDEAWR